MINVKWDRTILGAPGSILVITLLVSAANDSFAQRQKTGGSICGNPKVACTNGQTFQPNDLAFRLPAKLKWQTNYPSAFFYAVILQSRRAVRDDNVDSDDCSKGYFSESERKRVQGLFPEHKVFTSRNGCYGAWGNTYTPVNNDYEFIAVFGGMNEAQAKAVQSVANVKGYKDAYLRRMQVIYQNGD